MTSNLFDMLSIEEPVVTGHRKTSCVPFIVGERIMPNVYTGHYGKPMCRLSCFLFSVPEYKASIYCERFSRLKGKTLEIIDVVNAESGSYLVTKHPKQILSQYIEFLETKDVLDAKTQKNIKELLLAAPSFTDFNPKKIFLRESDEGEVSVRFFPVNEEMDQGSRWTLLDLMGKLIAGRTTKEEEANDLIYLIKHTNLAGLSMLVNHPFLLTATEIIQKLVIVRRKANALLSNPRRVYNIICFFRDQKRTHNFASSIDERTGVYHRPWKHAITRWQFAAVLNYVPDDSTKNSGALYALEDPWSQGGYSRNCVMHVTDHDPMSDAEIVRELRSMFPHVLCEACE